MKIAVLSDTHGNMELLDRALALARKEDSLDLVIHLGDEHTDIDGMLDAGEKAEVVPGIYHRDYTSGALPASHVMTLGGIVVGLAHQPSDLPSLQDRPEPRLLLHGHIHSLAIAQHPWGVTFNPGQLMKPVDKGRPASFGILLISGDSLTILGIDLEGRRLLESRWPFPLLQRGDGF